MRIERLGDSALLLREPNHPAHELAEWLNSTPFPGCIEAVASYDTVGVYFDIGSTSLALWVTSDGSVLSILPG